VIEAEPIQISSRWRVIISRHDDRPTVTLRMQTLGANGWEPRSAIHIPFDKLAEVTAAMLAIPTWAEPDDEE
jgi:hypothetical protein